VCWANPTAIASVANTPMGVETPTLTYTLALPNAIATYTPGGPQLNITLNGPGPFAGLLLYAATTVDNQNHVGTWTGGFDPARYGVMDAITAATSGCAGYGAGATLSHTDGRDKTVPATFGWNPPTAAVGGNVTFWAVVVGSGGAGFEVVPSGEVEVDA
ncbi:hypothetical protein BDK51DRAFT_30957, partial [Blyttiomyces helicus]